MAQYGTQNYTDQQVRDWYSAIGGDPAKIAQKAAELGATASDISRAIGIGSGAGVNAPSSGSIRNFVTDPANGLSNQYSWGSTGGLISATPAARGTSVVTPNATATPPAFPNVATAGVTNANAAAPISAVNAVQDQNLGTVQGRIAGLIAQDSPLMQRAAQRGLEFATQRGLQNSGMAIGSAQNAVYDAAIPIASADAASTNQFALTNAGEANVAERFNAGNQQQVNLSNAAAQNQANTFNAQQANQASVAQAEMASQVALQTLRGQQAQALAETEATYRSQIQTSASAANFYASVVQQMTASQTATGTTQEQKDAAAAYYNQALRNGMAIISAAGGESGTDLSTLLNFTGA